MLARALRPGEEYRHCPCGHALFCRVGDMCPRCHRIFPDVSAIHDALLFVRRSRGPAELARLAPVLGVEGEQLATDGRRVFGILDGRAA